MVPDGTSSLGETQLHFVDSLDEAWEMGRWASQRRDTPLAFDTESSGLSPERDRLRLIQIGDTQAGWAVPMEWSGAALEILRKYDGELVAHNLPHDFRFLFRQAGLELPWHKLHDTLLLASLDDPMRQRGLKPLAKQLVDPLADSGQRALDDGMKKQGWDWGTVPVDFGPYVWYSALDPVLTAHLWKHLYPRVRESCPRAYDAEMGANRICTRMMLKGLRIDRAYVTEAKEKLRTYADEARTWLILAYDITSLLSARQIAKALTANGEPPTGFTPTGLPQVNKEFLLRVKDYGSTQAAREIAEQVLGARHAEKLISAYLENFLARADSDDVVHCQIWQAQAVTGRMSCTEPALQTLSRDDRYIRGSFVPRDDHVFISCDYDQVEARLCAHYAEDEGLIRAFANADAGGPDFFAGIASQIFGREITKKDQERQLTKNVVYGACYGAGVEKMAQTAGVPVATMRPVKEAFDRNYPGVKRFSYKAIAMARSADELDGRPAVRSGLGRYLPVERGKEYVSVNRIIQAEAAEVLKLVMLDLEAAGLGPSMCLPIHDEILFEIPKDEAEDARHLIEETMTVRDRYRVPLTCGAQVLPERWQKG
jgi:DNA polymerase-1